MAMLKYSFNKKDLKEIQDTIKEWYGIEVSTRKINSLLMDEENDYLAKSCIYNNELCFDTGEREQFGDLVAQELTGMSWPCGMTPNKEKKKFWKKLEQASKNKKFKRDYSFDIDFKDYEWYNL